MFDWAENVNYAVTVCDAEANIIYMNAMSVKVLGRGKNCAGMNLKECHRPESWETIVRLLKEGGTNVYTISKNGQKKLVYQTAWYQDGKVAGLVETSMVLPDDMPHHVRN